MQIRRFNHPALVHQLLSILGVLVATDRFSGTSSFYRFVSWHIVMPKKGSKYFSLRFTEQLSSTPSHPLNAGKLWWHHRTWGPFRRSLLGSCGALVTELGTIWVWIVFYPVFNFGGFCGVGWGLLGLGVSGCGGVRPGDPFRPFRRRRRRISRRRSRPRASTQRRRSRREGSEVKPSTLSLQRGSRRSEGVGVLVDFPFWGWPKLPCWLTSSRWGSRWVPPQFVASWKVVFVQWVPASGRCMFSSFGTFKDHQITDAFGPMATSR